MCVVCGDRRTSICRRAEGKDRACIVTHRTAKRRKRQAMKLERMHNGWRPCQKVNVRKMEGHPELSASFDAKADGVFHRLVQLVLKLERGRRREVSSEQAIQIM